MHAKAWSLHGWMLGEIEKVWQLPHFLTINKIQVFWRLF